MVTSFALLDLGAPELLIVLAIVVLLFGGKKIPELSRSLGESIKELKHGMNDAADLKNEVKSQVTQTQHAIQGQEKVDSARVQ